MVSPLRIGVNALFLIPGGVGGTEIYLRQLLAAIAEQPRQHEYVVFVNRETGQRLAPSHPQFRTVETGVRAESRPGRILYEQFRLPNAAAKAGIDVLFNAGQTAPYPFSRPNVTFLFDLQHRRHPEFFKPADLWATRILMSASARWSREIVTISEASRRDIAQTYGLPLDRITAAEPGVDPDIAALPRGVEEPFVLYVSTLHPHKNHERLLDAFAAFRTRHPEYRLVLAGMHGFHHAAVLERIRRHTLESHVRVTGWIPRQEVLDLYSKARIAVFPSQFEGFGIPVLEAMTAGVPLIASNVPPMSDAAGEAAILADPRSVAEWTAALEKFAGDAALRAEYAERGRERARQFTWSRTAGAILDAIERVGAG